MSLEAATWVVYGMVAWLLLGLALALPFVFWAFGRVDAAGKGASLGVRLLLLPGCAVLWPVILWRWRRAP